MDHSDAFWKPFAGSIYRKGIAEWQMRRKFDLQNVNTDLEI
jgi:hypothetical protein